MKERFLREARAAAAIEDDHVIPIFQIGEDLGVPFIAMPFLKGQSLEGAIREQVRNRPAGEPGPLFALADVCRIGREIAQGLAAAHQRGLIHRDIKPANVWLEAKEEGGRRKDEVGQSPSSFLLPPSSFQRVKLLDFGLARWEGAGRQHLTQSGVLLGTPAYMAPEQARGEKLDGRADLFSLGVVLYRLCTGELPFQGSDTMSTLLALATHTPAPPHPRVKAVPRKLSDLVMKLLEKDAARRFASANELVQAIRTVEEGLARQAATEEPRPATAKAVAAPGKTSPRLLMAGAGLGLACVLAAGALFLLHSWDGTADGPVVGEKASAPPPLALAPFGAAEARAHQEAWAEYLGVPLRYENSLGMGFVLIPPGEFLMGVDLQGVDPDKLLPGLPPQPSERRFITEATPQHRVRLTQPFYMQTHEVRTRWFEQVLGWLPKGVDVGGGNPDYPLKNKVAWYDAIEFCDALSKREGKTPAHRVDGDRVTRAPGADGYRLPTEAEWEYACRAGTQTHWYFGNDPDGPRGNRHLLRHSMSDACPNPFGLFHLYGGSTEWCWDGYAPYGPEAIVDPVVAPNGQLGVVRGGSDYTAASVFTDNSFGRMGWHHVERGKAIWTGLGRLVLPVEAVKLAARK